MDRRFDFVRPLILAVFLAANLPILSWTDFRNAEESVNVATGMELLRDGHWKIPTLAGHQRLVKPPLTAWTTAAAISRDTLNDIDATGGADATFRHLAFESRWPATLLMAGLIFGTYEIANALAGSTLAAVAAMIVATNLLVMRFAQQNQTDTQLACWVTLLSASLVRVFVSKKPAWLLPAGIAFGLASLSKGPHLPILFSMLPLWVWWKFLRVPTELPEQAQPRFRTPWFFAGLAFAIALGFGWFIWVGLTTPNIWTLWVKELTRYEANNLAPIAWYHYFISAVFFLPWAAFIVVGVVQGAIEMRESSRRPTLLATVMLVLPFVVLCFFRERKERYLLPLCVPAAIVAARVMLDIIDFSQRKNRLASVMLNLHWLSIAVMAIGVPVIGATTRSRGLRIDEHTPVWSTAVGATMAGALAAAVLVLFIRRHRATSLATAGFIVFLSLNAAYTFAIGQMPGGQATMKPIAQDLRRVNTTGLSYREFHPSGVYGFVFANGAELEIYLNRTIGWEGDVAKGRDDCIYFTARSKKEPGDPTPPLGTHVILRYPRRVETLLFFGP